MKRNTFWGRHGGTLLTVASIVGVGATAVLSGLAALKLKPAIDELREADNKEDMVEAAKKIVKAAAPAVGAVATTVGCMVGVGTFDKKKQAALSGVAAAAAQKIGRYRDEVKKLYGYEAEDTIHENSEEKPGDEKRLFYIQEYGEFFEATMEEVLEAEYHFNRNFILRGYANLNEFFDFLRLDWKPEADDVGWSWYQGEVSYGYAWVDFLHESGKTDDGLEYTDIIFAFPPTDDYLNMA